MCKLLTIAIPTYNRKNYLKRALDSIMFQYDERIEILVSDNASDDGTEQMIHKSYPFIKYLRNNKNVGASANFNNCYENASGKYVLLLGSDDVIISGAINVILSFLEKNSDTTLIFMNHYFFVDEYIDDSHCQKIFLEKCDTFTTTNKKAFIEITRNQLSYMSCLILLKSSFESVENPEQYIWTRFLHTNIALEAVKDETSVLGVIGKPCIADDLTPGNATIDNDGSTLFKIFGTGLEYTFCVHAPKCGFNVVQMKKMYLETNVYKWGKYIIKCKCKDIANWKEHFYKYGIPIIKKYPSAFLFVYPAILLPKWAVKFIKYIYSVFHK